MRDYICDLCKKRITPSDIRMEIKVDIEGKEETVDMHSVCYYLFMRALKERLDELNEE